MNGMYLEGGEGRERIREDREFVGFFLINSMSNSLLNFMIMIFFFF